MLRVWLLGPMRLEVEGVALDPPASRKARLLLAILALERRRHSRESLAARLWPDVLDASARASLRTALRQLRVALGPAAGRLLDVTRDHVALAGPDLVWVDVSELDARLAEGDVATLGADHAVLLAGLEDDWVYERRDALRERLIGVLGRGAAAAEAGGDLAAAIGLTRRQAALDPLAEEPLRELVRRLAAAGDTAAALAAYERFAERLRTELRVVPSAPTRAVADAVRAAVRDRAAERRGELPSGVLTFLLTEIEDVAELWDADPARLADVIERHDELVARAVGPHDGRRLRSAGAGESTLTVFQHASDAVAAAAALPIACGHDAHSRVGEPRLRAAMYTGEARERAGDYFGPGLSGARGLLALAQGGGMLVSRTTVQIARDRLPAGVELIALGERALPGVARPEPVFELRRVSTPAAAGGSAVRKTVTVLYADLVEAARPDRDPDPEIRQPMVSRRLAALRTALERAGASVETLAGDVLVAVFGVPLVHEDDALRAVRAAIALGRPANPVADDPGVRVGIETGEVIAEREDRAVTGEPFTLARRLCELARASEVVIGPATHRIVSAVVTASPLDARTAAAGAPPRAYRLEDVVPGASLRVRRFGGPILGRDRQLAALRAIFANVVADRACHLVTILGSAGVGKSRLVEELVGSLSDAAVLSGRCLAYGEAITFWPLAEAVRGLLGNAEPSATAIAAAAGDDPQAELIGAGVATALGARDGPGATNAEIVWAARKLFEAVARRRVLVIVFDDLHWAEPTFLDFLDGVVELVRDVPVLLLCMARPELLEIRAGWGGGKVNLTTVMLEPLAAEDAQRLIGGLLGDAPLPAAVVRLVAEAAEGNPLFAEEFVAMLIDDGRLRRSDGEWTAHGDVARLPVPPTISALLASRLERLPAGERANLERAAVEGTRFHRAALCALAPESPPAAVDAALDRLLRKDLIRPDRSDLLSGEAFRFRHALIRDAAYAALPKRARAELHDRFGSWLEDTAGARLREVEEIVGHHLAVGSDLLRELGVDEHRARSLGARASHRLESAGRRALARGDRAAAISMLQRATALHDPGDDARLVGLLTDKATALVEAGRLAEAEEALRRASRHAMAAGDARADARLALQQQFLRLEQAPEEATREAPATVERAIDVLARHSDEYGLCRALRLRALLHWFGARTEAAAAAWEEAAEHARRAGAEHERAEILVWIASSLVYGPTPVAEAIGRCEAIAAQVKAHLVAHASTLPKLAALHAMDGRFTLARRLLAESRAALDELGLGLNSAVSHHAALVELLAGGEAEAERNLRRGYEALERMGDRALLSTTAAYLARAVLDQGRDAEAAQYARRSDELAAADDVSTQAMWRGVQARVLAGQSRFDDAERLAQEAVGLLERTDFVGQQGEARLDLAVVLEAAGRPGDAGAALAESLACFERKGNRVAAAQVAARLAALAPR